MFISAKKIVVYHKAVSGWIRNSQVQAEVLDCGAVAEESRSANPLRVARVGDCSWAML